MAKTYKVGGLVIEDSAEALAKITVPQLTAAATFISAYSSGNDLSSTQRQDAAAALGVVRREGAARVADGTLFK